MNKVQHLFQPGREHLEKRKDEIEKILKGTGRYERHRQGRKSIVLEMDDLKKELREIKVMIKAQQKFDKKTDPSIEERKVLRTELMSLPKSKLADLYLNLRFSEAMIQNFHMPVYKRGLDFEREFLDKQKKTAEQRKKNNRQKVEKTLLEAKITVTSKTTPGVVIARLNELNIPQPLSDKPMREHLAEIIKDKL